jgi:hypothetical protein
MNKDNSSLDYIQKKIHELNKKIDICNIFLNHNIRYFPDIFSIKDERDKSFIFSEEKNIDYIHWILPNPQRININKLKDYETILKEIPSEKILDTKFDEYFRFTYFNADLHSKTTTEEERKNIIEKLEYYCNYIKNLDIDKYYKSIIKELKKELKILQGFSNTKSYVPTPNSLRDAINKNQKGKLSELDDNSKRDVIKTLICEIYKDNELTDKEKEYAIDRIKNTSNTLSSFDINKYLGINLSEIENIVLRAIRDIVYQGIKLKQIENIHNPIEIPLHILYKKCGVNKRDKDKGYYSGKTKEIINTLMSSNLTTDIIVKSHSFNQRIIKTRFIGDSIFDSRDVEIKTEQKGITKIQTQYTKVKIKVSEFLFNENINDISNCYMQDTTGYINFKKINRTKIGNDLFLYLESYLSTQDIKKELNLTTIINTLGIEKEFKKKKIEVVQKINRALEDMKSSDTLIKDYKQEKGVSNQEKYILYNARYVEKTILKKDKNKNTTPHQTGEKI